MTLDVPFFSQHAPDVPEEWRRRSCGILTLRMALAYFLKEQSIPSAVQLIQEADAIHGWTEQGIDHEAIIRLAHNYGIPAYREEFRSVAIDVENHTFTENGHSGELLSYGMKKLYAALEKGQVVLASVPRKMQEGGTPHAVVITGYEKGDETTLYYHDPDYLTPEEGAYRVIDEATFKTLWRRFMRVLGPSV